MKRSYIFLAALAFSTCAFADTMTWVATGSNQFGTLDLNTGSYNTISDLGFTPAGLGEIGSTVYTADGGGTTLYKVDPTTGSTSTVGTSRISYYAFGSTRTGLYMIDTVGALWSINASTGAATSIGSTLLLIGGNTYAMSTGSDSLYFALGDSVYSINTSTAKASFVGSTTPNYYGALVDVQDKVYGTTTTGADQTFSFDPTTGNNTFLANASVPGYAYGLAPVVPEPGSFALLGLGAMLLGGYALKRRLA